MVKLVIQLAFIYLDKMEFEFIGFPSVINFYEPLLNNYSWPWTLSQEIITLSLGHSVKKSKRFYFLFGYLLYKSYSNQSFQTRTVH